MKQHPVPQQISSYQFRLVGDMTLKQFGQLAAGVIIAIIIYSTGVHPIIKVPLIIFSIAAGAATAFLPYKERPLTEWVYSFFRSIYSPTEYVWSTKNTKYNFFSPDATDPTQVSPDEEKIVHKEEKKPTSLKKLDGEEKEFLQKVNLLLKGDEEEYKRLIQQPTQTQESAQDIIAKLSGNQVAPGIQTNTPPDQPSSNDLYVSNNNQSNQTNQYVQNQTGISMNNTTTQDPAPPTQNTNISNTIDNSQNSFRPTVQVQNQAYPQAINISNSQNNNLSTPQQNQPVQPVANTQPAPQNTQTDPFAQFSSDTPPPSPPERANTLSGQVLDASGKAVVGAILEVTNESGSPMRAVRTNKNGHFSVVTPLHNGVYNITTEKENYEFKPLKFEALGEIIPPIAIRAVN